MKTCNICKKESSEFNINFSVKVGVTICYDCNPWIDSLPLLSELRFFAINNGSYQFTGLTDSQILEDIDCYCYSVQTPINSYSNLRDQLEVNPLLVFVEIPFTGHSDYSGGITEYANCKYFEKKIEADEDYKDVKIFTGDFSSRMVAIPLLQLTERIANDMNDLMQYPLIDEDNQWKIEQDWIAKSWSDFIRHDFISKLKDKFEDGPNIVERLCQIKDFLRTNNHFGLEPQCDNWQSLDSQLFDLLSRAAESANEYWFNEQINSMYIRLEPIVREVLATDILAISTRATV